MTERHDIKLAEGLKTRHRKLMLELAAGATHAEAAARTGFSISRVSELARSPLFKNELDRIVGEVEDEFISEIASDPIVNEHKKTLDEQVGKSIDTLINLRDDIENPTVRLRSATELLDRAGFVATEEVHATITVDADEGLKHMLGQVLSEKNKDATN